MRINTKYISAILLPLLYLSMTTALYAASNTPSETRAIKQTQHQKPSLSPFYFATPYSKGFQFYTPGIASQQSSTTEKPFLILIHGIAPKSKQYYGWRPFLQAMEKQHPDLFEHYRVVFFVFDPAQSVESSSQGFQQSFQQLYRIYKPQGISVAALSLGGLVARDALLNGESRHKIDRVITLGTPFHGTPLANPDWMRTQLRQEPYWHVLNWGNRLVYGITRQKFPHFQTDYAWDNYDNSVPENFRQTCRPKQYRQAKTPAIFQEKLITYGGFFGKTNQDTQALLDMLNTPTEVASALSGTKTRMKGFLPNKHSMMAMVSPNISDIVSPQPATTETDATAAFSPNRFNDGVCPITSHLWLGRFMEGTVEDSFNTHVTAWQALKDLKKENNARLFYGLDHRDWLEGTTRSRKNTTADVPDLLHPEEDARPVFEWLYQDLMAETPQI